VKALSIRQPWAWLIVRPDIVGDDHRMAAYANGSIKDIENRDWRTDFRGRFLVHASKGMTREEYESGVDMLWLDPGVEPPSFEAMQRGGFVGSVDLVDCVDDSESEWFFGNWGFVLRDARPMPFIAYKGRLGFFDVPDDIIATPDRGGERG
jgi:hypothetical protein